MADIQKIDPIRDTYFVPLNRAEASSDALFYVGAVVSLVVFFVEKTSHPVIYSVLQGALIVSVLAMWALNAAIRSYFAPRAHDRRFEDFLSSALGVPLSGHEATEGYYHTDAQGVLGVGARLLENTLHSKDTALRMAWCERAKAAVYVVLLVVAALNRTTDLSFLAIVAQAVFSEQLLSRWIRIEWMRHRFEAIHSELYRLFQAKPTKDRFNALVWSLVGQYESVKANAAITLSRKIFERRNQVVSAEWQRIRTLLDL
jgi:hypothetical protein